MTLVYLDSSALVKLCVLENGTPLAVALWEGAAGLITSQLADAEIRAVLAAGERIGRIDAAPAAQAKGRWEELWPSLITVPVSTEIITHAGQIVAKRPLRAADAIHLASALLFTEAKPLFAAWDRRLASAARAEGLTVLPPAIS